jgi:hypothetical protein
VVVVVAEEAEAEEAGRRSRPGAWTRERLARNAVMVGVKPVRITQ